jgi:hypothetical protein
VVLEDRLRRAVVRLNPQLPPEALEDAYRIGTLGAGREWFNPWRTITGRDDAAANLAEP